MSKIVPFKPVREILFSLLHPASATVLYKPSVIPFSFRNDAIKFLKNKAIFLACGIFLLAMGMVPAKSFAQTNFTGTWSSVTISNSCPSATSNYTLSATNPASTGNSTANSFVTSGKTVTITFPSGFTLSTITSGTLNGTAIGTITKTATTVSFATPVSIAKGAAFTIVLNGITNNSTAGNYQLSMTIGNATGGNNIFNAGINSQFTITQNATISLTSAAGTNAQTPCINTAITNITYAIGGSATGATVTGLPTGVSGSYSSGVFTISGTANAAAGTYNYTVNTTGTCVQTSANGTITIKPAATISLTSVAGTDAQIPCINTAITNITYTIGGGGTGAIVTGLPTGVNGSYTAGVFTISGTPTSAAGTYNYTVTTTGTCTQANATGTITVKPNATISLTSAVGTDVQTLCINTAITNITYTIGGGGTGATVTGLPTGVNGSYSAGVFTISGTATAVAGTYNYTINTTGACAQTSVNGSIIIKPDATISLSSVSGTDAQTPCNNSPITAITYLIAGGGAGAIVTGLPSGVTGSYNAGVFTISGTPNAAAGIYNYTVSTTGTCTQATANGSITVNAQPQGSLSSNGPFCTSGDGMLTWTSTAGTGPFTIIYNDGTSDQTQNNVTSGTAFNLFTNPLSTTSTYTIVSVTDNNGCTRNNGFTDDAATITIYQPVVITNQPSDETACATFPATFQVNATGDGLTYQWYKNGSPLSNGGRISGVTTNTLNYSQVNLTLNGAAYHVVVSGTSPCPSVTSVDVVLNVDQKIAINTQPVSQTICANEAVSFSVDASASDPLSYQWRKNGVDMAGETNSTLTISNVSASDAADYDVVISGPVGYSCPTIFSSKATLIVNPVSVGGTVSGTNTVCSGSNSGTLTLSGQTGNVVSWESSTDGGTTWITIANTTTSQSYTNLTQTTLYRAVVQSGVCSIANSSFATITVDPVSVGGAVSGAASVCSGNNSGSVTLSGQTGNIVRWESSINGGTTWTTITNTTTSQSYTNITQTTLYRAVVQSGLCSIASSSSATITVNPVSVGGSVSGTTTVCSGSNSGALTLSGQTGNVVRWESSINGGTTWTTIANTTTSQPYTNITQTTLYRAVVQSGVCSISNSSSATITVNPVSVGGTVSGTTTVCSGSNSGTLTLSGQTGNIIRWESSTNGGTTWTTITNTTTSQSYTNLTQTTQYRAVVQSGVCSIANSSSATITINPVSVGGTLTPSSASGCVGSNNGTISLSGQTGSVIRWESSVNAGTSWTTISNTSTTQSYSNLTQTTIYRAVVQSGVCVATANSSNAVIVVNPTFTPAVTATPVTMCLGQSATLSASGYSTSTGPFTGGDFSNANPTGWRVTDNGVSINFPASADNQNTNPWSETNGPKTFNGITYNSQLGGKFAIANGAETTTLETPVFSTIGLTSASLQFYQAFNFNAGTTGKIEISLDGGTTYNTVLQQYTGPSTFGTPNGGFALVSIPLTNYLGQSNLRIRFSYTGTAGSNWAIDNVSIPDPYQSIAYTWTPSTYLSVDTGKTVVATPTVAGTFTYTVNTIVGGCAGGSTNITLTVNPLPSISASLTSQSICSGSSIIPVSFTSNVNPTTYSWARNNTASVTGIAASGTGTISGTLTNTTSNPVTVTFTITPTANTCGGNPITVTVIVNPVPQASISGSATICNGQSVTLSINVTGSNGTISGTLSDGTPFSGTAPTILVNVKPAVTTTYTISSLTNGSCAASGLTGTATVICPNGPAGLWTGAKDKDWFNCLNWADGKIPTTAVDVTIQGTATNVCNIDAVSSPYAPSYGNVAQSKSLTVDNNTLSFINSSDSLIVIGNVTIKNAAVINMTNGGKFEVQGNWDDQVSTSGLGFKDGIGNVILTGAITQTISSAKTTELFYNLKVNKTSGIVSLLKNITVDNNLTLIKGIFATNNNLFTWSNITGSIILPAAYTDSYICTCNSNGSAITATGSNGFRINNVRGNSEQMFPVSSDLVSPNRMSLNMNNSASDDFTVVVGKGDIGGTSAPVVKRIWYVSEATPGGSTTTMKLYFTKRNWSIYPFGSAQNDEVENGFLWTDPHLVQKDNNNAFVNVATTGTSDVPDYMGNAFNTEIYGRYFINVSSDYQGNKNGINAFNKFSVVNMGNIILPVTLANIKAYQKNSAIEIDWTALNELNIDHYEVERSANAVSFTSIETVVAHNNNLAENYYNVPDKRPLQGNNFYRIKVVDKNGKVSYSAVVVINTGNAKSSVAIQPNPVLNKIINLQLNNIAAGSYTIAICNMSGQQICNQKIMHAGGNAMQQIILPSSVAHGVYIVRVFNKTTTYNMRVVIE